MNTASKVSTPSPQIKWLTPERLILYALFSLSGCAALVLEVIWSRQLSLTFGTTMPAVSSVAAVFMCGLAIGNVWLGRLADRVRTPLMFYAGLEAGVAITGIGFPFLLDLITALYIQTQQNFPELPLITGVVRVFFSSLLLLPATICMGGTFPTMCRQVARGRVGLEAGKLYAFNTLGGAFGAGLAGFWLLPNLGLASTNRLAIGAFLLIAAGASILSSAQRGSARLIASSPLPQPLQASYSRPRNLWIFSVALTGASALAYEILWTRMFMQFMGSTVYAFASILCMFLVGIASGGALASCLLRRGGDSPFPFLSCLILMPLSVLVFIPAYDDLAFLFQQAFEISKGNWAARSIFSLLLAGLVMIIPTTLSGALLPLAIALSSPTPTNTGTIVGKIVTWNTVGAIIGSLAAGFFLLPLFGLENAFEIVSIAGLSAGIIVCIRFQRVNPSRLAAATFIALGLALAFVIPSWDQGLMNSGVYYYAYRIQEAGGLRSFVNYSRLLTVIEGRDSTIAVKESPDGAERFLSINGKTDAGNGYRDMPTQLLLAHLPLLLHPHPETALVVGLGSGITFGAAAKHPLRHLTCVEISKEVKSAAKFFSKENHNILADSRAPIVIEDARNYLMTRTQSYDVIISEPSNPWQSGNANLFTIEFYRLALDHLNNFGIFCQWLPLYDLPPDHLRVVFRTFSEVFPNVLVFHAAESDLILLGSKFPLVFDYRALQNKIQNPALSDDLAPIQIKTAGDLIGRYFLSTEKPILRLAENFPVNSDNKPYLEFSYRYIFQPQLLEQNLSILHDNLGRQRLPLVNPGDSIEEKRSVLLDLGQGFRASGREDVASYFFELLKDL